MIDHNDLETPTGQRSEKAFKSLQATFAMAGHTLARTEAKDGAVGFYVHRWGHVKYLPDLDAVAAFLRQIGGNHA